MSSAAAPVTSMTPIAFIKKWRPVALTERQAAQEHFIDLCRLVGHPTPIEADPTGESYCFEKGALKSVCVREAPPCRLIEFGQSI